MGGGQNGARRLVASLDELLIRRGRGSSARRPRRERAALPAGARLGPDRAGRRAAPRRGPLGARRRRRRDRALRGRGAARRRRSTLDNVGFFNNYANVLRRGKRYGAGRGAAPPARRRRAEELAGVAQPRPGAEGLRALRRSGRAAAPRGRARARARPEPRGARRGAPPPRPAAQRRRVAAPLHRARLGHRRQPLDDARQHRSGSSATSPRRSCASSTRSSSRRAPRPRTATSRSRTRQVGRFDEAIEHLRTVDQARARQRHHALERFVRAADRGRDRRRLGRVGVGPARPARQRAPDEQAPLDARRTADGRVLCTASRASATRSSSRRATPTSSKRPSDVVIESDPRLAPLFARSFPGAEVRAQTINLVDGETMHDFDYAIPAGSLPLHFRASLAGFPDRRSFLVADPERVAAWQARLAEIGPGPFVGHVVAQPREDRRAPARVHAARPVGRALRDPRRHVGQPPVRRLRTRAPRRPSASSA